MYCIILIILHELFFNAFIVKDLQVTHIHEPMVLFSKVAVVSNSDWGA